MSRKSSGHILVFTLSVLGILLVLTTAALNLIRSDQQLANKSYRVKQARQIAEAGVDLAIRRLNDNSNYSGETDVPLGDGTLSIAISGSGSERKIEAFGYVPNSTNPISKRKIIVDASIGSTEVEFFYGVQVDAGGLEMDNGSTVNGNVYSNGNIIGSNNASITGDAIVAGGLSDNPTLEWATLNDDNFFATTNSNRDTAQSFVSPSDNPLNKLSVFISKINSPSNNINVRITEDDSGEPKNSSLASSIISVNSVGTTPSWVDVSFATAPNLDAGKKYWIVLDNSSSSATDYWNWREDNTGNYANNTAMYTSNWSSGGANWTDLNSDLGFRIWLGGTTTRIEGMTVGNSSSGTGRANSFVNTTIHGSSCPNQYCIIESPSNEPLPFSDGLLQDWRDDATEGGTIVGDYSLTNGQTASLGPKKIQGNLLLDNSAVLTMTGTIYVTGDVTLSNGCQVKLDTSYGTASGVFITDGDILVDNNCSFSGAGQDSYILLVTTKDDKDNISVTISNNSVGVIYYAGKTRMKFSNNASAKEATAWGIQMDNNASITYESGLSNVLFSNGPGGGWAVKRSTWREVRIF